MRITAKSVIIILSLALVAACGQKPQDPDEIKNQIFDTKQKLAELEDAYELALKDSVVDRGAVNVRTKKLVKQQTDHIIRTTGIAEADQMAYVAPETNGQIKKIHVREGQRVSNGQLLVSLNSAVLQNTKSEVEKSLELAEIMYEKQKKLFDKGVGKEVEYLQAKNQKESLEAKLKTLRSQLEMSQLRAPFAGIVDQINSIEGEPASPGMRLILLVNLNRITIKANVAEHYIPVITEGKDARVTFNAYPDMEIETKVSRTGNVIDPTNRTFAVEVRTNNPDGKIKPNMVCELHLTDYSGDEILVPSSIVRNDREGEFVYVVGQKDGRKIAEKKYISTGFTVGADIVVKEGLSEGDIIITEGANMLSNGIELNILD